jgi:Ca2+-binding EF-hand superfamily protein
MKPKTILALGVAAAAAVPLGAFAQANQGAGDAFSRYDRDGDGTISRSEWRQSPMPMGNQQQSQQVQQGDPQWVVVSITPVEERIMQEQRRESLFRALDANGNGAISAAEAGLNVQLLNAFAQLDRNNNSVIDRQEFASVHVQEQRQQQATSQQQNSAAVGGTASKSASPGQSGDKQ